MKAWLLEHLRRPAFTPLGCAALAEDAQHLFEPLPNVEYAAHLKTLSLRCTSRMHDNSPAAIHVDGTARVQLVTEQSQPGMYSVLREYKHLTGLACVVSINMSLGSEPLACSPLDAIRVFLAGKIDYLAMGEFLIAAPQRVSSPSFDGQHVTST